MEPFRKVELRDISSPASIGTQIVDSCRQARLVLVHANRKLGVELDFWDEVLGCNGRNVERVPIDEEADTGQPTGHLWSNVEFDPARRHRFRHSSTAQPLHTDGAYVGNPPSIVFMVCSRPAPAGGATIFLDGPDLIQLLSREQPSLFRALAGQPLVFGKGPACVESTVIVPGSRGPLLRWNYYAVAWSQLSPAERKLAEDFRVFLDELTRRSIPRAIGLQAGDAVFFHDDRVLHGRESFMAKSAGDRCLWKGGLKIRADDETPVNQ